MSALTPRREEIDLDPILEFFSYEHLPPHLRVVSALFCDLAVIIVRSSSSSAERSVSLRKLLESKDAAVRAALVSP